MIDIDSYYRPLDTMTPAERDRVNFDHPDRIDFPLLIAQLRQLLAGEPIEKPVYDFAFHTRASRTVHIEPREVIVVEGILSLSSPALRDLYDLKVFVDVADDVRLRRRISRDVLERGRTPESVLAQYEATVRPMHQEFVEPAKAYADLVLLDGSLPLNGWDELLRRVRSELQARRTDLPM